MKQIAYITVGIVAILIGLGFLLPALAKWRSFGYLPGGDIGLLLLGIALALGGPGVAFIGCRKRRA